MNHLTKWRLLQYTPIRTIVSNGQTWRWRLKCGKSYLATPLDTAWYQKSFWYCLFVVPLSVFCVQHRWKWFLFIPIPCTSPFSQLSVGHTFFFCLLLTTGHSWSQRKIPFFKNVITQTFPHETKLKRKISPDQTNANMNNYLYAFRSCYNKNWLQLFNMMPKWSLELLGQSDHWKTFRFPLNWD